MFWPFANETIKQAPEFQLEQRQWRSTPIDCRRNCLQFWIHNKSSPLYSISFMNSGPVHFWGILLVVGGGTRTSVNSKEFANITAIKSLPKTWSIRFDSPWMGARKSAVASSCLKREGVRTNRPWQRRRTRRRWWGSTQFQWMTTSSVTLLFLKALLSCDRKLLQSHLLRFEFGTKWNRGRKSLAMEPH